MDGLFHGWGSPRVVRTSTTAQKGHHLASAKPTAAFGLLPHDCFTAVSILILVSPGTTGSQKQQKKIRKR